MFLSPDFSTDSLSFLPCTACCLLGLLLNSSLFAKNELDTSPPETEHQTPRRTEVRYMLRALFDLFEGKLMKFLMFSTISESFEVLEGHVIFKLQHSFTWVA